MPKITRRYPNGSYSVTEEADTLKAGIDTLRQARMLNAVIEKERPHYYPKKRTLLNNWQLDLHDEILDRGVRF